MACFHPIRAWRLSSGSIVFAERGDVVQTLELPCGQCIGCRLERSRKWAMRCMHEAQMHESNLFVTLTYDDEHLPADGSLVYRHFQLFMKSLRKLKGKVRFYMCGEYGELNRRPHYHAILFGVDFEDKVLWQKTSSGSMIYRSPTLERLWFRGHSSIGDVTFESAAYCARYVMKKVTGHRSEEAYRNVDAITGEIYQIEPEFCRMSLKPGIGAGWLEKYGTDVYPLDRVVVNGVQCKPPRYYDKKYLWKDVDGYEEMKYRRFLDGRALNGDNSDERLLVKERVLQARIKSLKRSLN